MAVSRASRHVVFERSHAARRSTAEATAIPAGTQLQVPGSPIEVEWETHVGFVDRQPTANWGHSCRYLLIGENAGEYRVVRAGYR